MQNKGMLGMKTVIVYDSFFGNTEKIAQAIGAALGGDTGIFRVGDVTPQQVKSADLVIIGSPTRAFRPSERTRAFLKSLAENSLQGKRVAAFDTRIAANETNSAILKFFVKIFGYAAAPMAAALKKKGGTLVLPGEGFIVKASEGPLKDGELERAAAWGGQLLAAR